MKDRILNDDKKVEVPEELGRLVLTSDGEININFKDSFEMLTTEFLEEYSEIIDSLQEEVTDSDYHLSSIIISVRHLSDEENSEVMQKSATEEVQEIYFPAYVVSIYKIRKPVKCIPDDYAKPNCIFK